MLVKDIKNYEYKYYGCHNDMVIPELLCYYFEEGAYELVHYLSELHRKEFTECYFYWMMAKAMLGYDADAKVIHKSNEGEWYHVCKQFDIYWKHVALYGLLFKDYAVSSYYQEVFDVHYDNECVEALLLFLEMPELKLDKMSKYKLLVRKYPIFQQIMEREEQVQTKDIATFEKMQWKIWNKYNLAIGNGNLYGIEEVYLKDDIHIFSYKPKEVSASMHIITDYQNTLILDCGCEINDMEPSRLPVKKILESLNLQTADAVLITHAHMDHYGSINEVKGMKLYMTEETYQLIKCVSPEMYLRNVNFVTYKKAFSIGDIEIQYIPNGHIRGSAMIDINWKNAYRIVYTGDYSVEDQETVPGFCVEDILENPKRVDVLITESTYGGSVGMLTLKEYVTVFQTLCEKYVNNGNKLIILAFTIGRCQETALLLAELAKENEWKILIDGTASVITGYYQMNIGKNILNKNITVCHNELEYEEKIFHNHIILASSGMLKEGTTSARYVEKMMDENKVCVMKVGFIHAGEHMLRSIINRQNMNLRYVDIPLFAHASYQSLIETTEKISPDCAIYVHGNGIAR